MLTNSAVVLGRSGLQEDIGKEAQEPAALNTSLTACAIAVFLNWCAILCHTVIVTVPEPYATLMPADFRL